MAYYEDGTYYFNPEIDGSDAEALEKAEQMEAAMKYKQFKNAQAYESNLSKTLMDEALKEAGLTHAEYQKLFYEDHEASKELLAEGMKYMTKSLAARKNKKPQPRQSQSEQPQPKEKRPNEVVEKAREKVNRGSNLTLDEELDVLNSLVGRLV